VKDKEKEEYVRVRKREEGRVGVSDEEIEVRCAIGGVGEGKNHFFGIFLKKKFVLCL
jgi:hypothetical protein